jgi:BlaI family penicillinase repressor
MLSKNTISPSEFKVMEILWATSPLSVSQIIQELEDIESWHSRTIKSLINRLLMVHTT